MKIVKKLFLILSLVVLVVLVSVIGYVIYANVVYYRLPDKLELSVENNQSTLTTTGKAYTILTYNVGFGAYSADYSFFMDGGKYSRAYSKEAVEQNISGAMATIESCAPTLILLQEVDKRSTRSYHVNEVALACKAFSYCASVYAQNYDSPYYFWPLACPHGKSLSGIVTLSALHVGSALRRSLPVEQGFSKFFDLDRCYDVSRLPVDNGKTLCLYNVHLSAYTTDGTIATDQLSLLLKDMQGEYEGGNYVICGGDFNKDLLGNSEAVFGISSDGQPWTQAFPFDMLPDKFTLIAALDPNHPVASCRNASEPYDPATSFRMTCDGFIVSDNVQTEDAQVIETGYAYADHNPVRMRFTLKK